MKLRTKISLAATLSLLIFSQLISVFILWNVKKINLNGVLDTQKEILQEQVVGAAQELAALQTETGAILPEVAANRLRNSMDVYTVVWQGERQIRNSTSYEIDPGWFWQEIEEHPQKLPIANGSPDFIAVREAALEKTHLLLMAKRLDFQDEKYLALRIWDVSELYERIQSLFWGGLVISLALGAVMLALLQAVLLRILRPFYRMKETANIIASGDYSRRLPVGGGDEIAEVSESFNRMAQRVEEHISELTELNERQTQMIGNMAHELKTPMTAISGYSETLLRVKLSPERQEQALNYIRSECRRLSSLSVKLLELTGLYHEEETFRKERFPAQKLKETLELMMRERLKQKRLRLQITVEPENLTVEGDWDLLVSMLTNLLDNSCKASAEGGVIYLTIDRGGFCVRDEGEGIAAGDLSRVTEAFYMADKSRSRRQGGAGLGLALCSESAKLHGAKLEIESEPGRGTVVSVRYIGEFTERLHSGGDSDTGKR